MAVALMTAADYSAQIVAQARILEPAFSAMPDTPERLMIDTFSQALADCQIDLTGLGSGLNVDSKYGSNLDQFTSLFGYARQSAVAATGYVIFFRNTPAPATIYIPAGTTIQANQPTANGQYLQYATTAGGTIPTSSTSSGSVPVACSTTGVQGNAPSATLTNLVGVPIVPGVTSVSNLAPITGGQDAEDDNSYKARFKNTIFRNLAGTTDQYLALAVSTSYTTMANVIGPVSLYTEYVQIPPCDDAGYLNGSLVTASPILPVPNTGGAPGQWTTALSAIPYAQDIYTDPPPFVSTQAVAQYFFRQGVDYTFNYPSSIVGDAERENESNTTAAPNWTFLNVYNPSNLNPAPAGLQSAVPDGILLVEYSYLSSASRDSIQRNVYNAVDIYVNGSNPISTSCVFLPGIQTFTSNPTDPMYFDNYRRDGEPVQRPHPGNFYTPLLNTPITSVPSTITIGTGNYYLGWHYWLIHDTGPLVGSIRARDGIEWSNFLTADTVSAPDSPPSINSNLPYTPAGTSATLIDNLTPGTTIEVDDYNFDSNVVTLQATIETARQITTDALVHSATTRYLKVDVTVIFSPNANVAVTQAAIGTAIQAYMQRQYFGTVIKLSDLIDTIFQVPGVDNVRWSNDLPNPPTLMRVIATDVLGNPLHQPWIDRIVGGTVSSSPPETQRLYIPGATLNSGSSAEFQGGWINSSTYGQGDIVSYNSYAYISLINSNSGNQPNVTQSAWKLSPYGYGDCFQLSWNDTGGGGVWTSSPIYLQQLTAANVQAAIQTGQPGSGLYYNITVIADSLVVSPLQPLVSFQLSYTSNGTPYLPSIVNTIITNSIYAYDSDFYLLDDELPNTPPNALFGVDTVPGAIIRTRAPNTFVRPGLA